MRPLGGQALKNLVSEVRVLRPRAAAWILVMRIVMMMVPFLAQQERAHGPLNAGRCGVLREPQSDVLQRGGHSRNVVGPSSHHSLAKVASEAGQARQEVRDFVLSGSVAEHSGASSTSKPRDAPPYGTTRRKFSSFVKQQSSVGSSYKQPGPHRRRRN